MIRNLESENYRAHEHQRINLRNEKLDQPTGA